MIDVFVGGLGLASWDLTGPRRGDGAAVLSSVTAAEALVTAISIRFNRADSSSERLAECLRSCGLQAGFLPITRRLLTSGKTTAGRYVESAPGSSFCAGLGSIRGGQHLIDGGKLKAVNNGDKTFTRAKMGRHLAQIEESVARSSSRRHHDRQEPSDALETKATQLRGEDEEAEGGGAASRRPQGRDAGGAGPTNMVDEPNFRSMATSGSG